MAVLALAVVAWRVPDRDSGRVIALPTDVGVPTEIVRFRCVLHQLPSRALLPLADPRVRVLARISDKRTRFELDDGFRVLPRPSFEGSCTRAASATLRCTASSKIFASFVPRDSSTV